MTLFLYILTNSLPRLKVIVRTERMIQRRDNVCYLCVVFIGRVGSGGGGGIGGEAVVVVMVVVVMVVVVVVEGETNTT